MQAMTDYMTSIAKLFREMGTLLDRDQIEIREAPAMSDD